MRIYRGRNWLGQPCFVLHYGRRRYFFATLTAAQTGQTRIVAQVAAGRLPPPLGACVAAVLSGLLLAALLAPALRPALVPAAVDTVRGVTGPVPVAYVETWAFQALGIWRQLRVAAGFAPPPIQLDPVSETGGASAGAWERPVTGQRSSAAATDPGTGERLATPGASQAQYPVTANAAPEPTAAPSAPTPWLLAALTPLIADGARPAEGQWRPLGASVGPRGAAMAVTTLRPDPARPDVEAAIVAVDLTRARLNLVAGTEEPPPPPGVRRAGMIPDADLQSGRLLAAFNGGFKAVHGADGMASGGVVQLAAQPDRATLAIAPDGTVQIGLWGREFGPQTELAAWRQNGRLLVEQGAVTAAAQRGGLGWGATLDLQVETWRSGAGLSQDGTVLYYAVGDALTAARLAETLRAAGAWQALQLDINSYWVRFVTFQESSDGVLRGKPLFAALTQEPQKYLAPDKRDFFYIVAR